MEPNSESSLSQRFKILSAGAALLVAGLACSTSINSSGEVNNPAHTQPASGESTSSEVLDQSFEEVMKSPYSRQAQVICDRALFRLLDDRDPKFRSLDFSFIASSSVKSHKIAGPSVHQEVRVKEEVWRTCVTGLINYFNDYNGVPNPIIDGTATDDDLFTNTAYIAAYSAWNGVKGLFTDPKSSLVIESLGGPFVDSITDAIGAYNRGELPISMMPTNHGQTELTRRELRHRETVQRELALIRARHTAAIKA